MNIQVLIFFITMTTWTTLLGQDGSDILYGKVNQLDKSYIGNFVHLDFYNRSSRGRGVDTVTIIVDSKPLRFVEHREDDGYNNWFNRQYLQALDKVDNVTIRVVKSRLDKITIDSVFVTNYLEYFNGDKIMTDKSKEVSSKFLRNIVVDVLVSEESHRRQ